MGYFICRCGEEIQLKEIPQDAEAGFFPQRDEMAVVESCAKDLAAFFAAISIGNRAEWISANISSACVGLSDQTIIHDLLDKRMQEKRRSMLECRVCGRIYLQSSGLTGKFVGFRPEPTSPSQELRLEQSGPTGFVAFKSECVSSLSATVPPAELGGDYGCIINSAPTTAK